MWVHYRIRKTASDIVVFYTVRKKKNLWIAECNRALFNKVITGNKNAIFGNIVALFMVLGAQCGCIEHVNGGGIALPSL